MLWRSNEPIEGDRESHHHGGHREPPSTLVAQCRCARLPLLFGLGVLVRGRNCGEIGRWGRLGALATLPALGEERQEVAHLVWVFLQFLEDQVAAEPRPLGYFDRPVAGDAWRPGDDLALPGDVEL